MWISKQKLKEVLCEMLGLDSNGNIQICKLKKELEELKLKKDIAERDIQHLVKLKEEKLDLEFQKKEVALEKEFQQKEMALQKEFHGKVVTQIKEAGAEMKSIHEKILKRLPVIKCDITHEAIEGK